MAQATKGDIEYFTQCLRLWYEEEHEYFTQCLRLWGMRRKNALRDSCGEMMTQLGYEDK